jgi:hypothetical protein
MKKISLLATLFFGLSAFAQIPTEVAMLLPTGADHIELNGTTHDGKACKVQMRAYDQNTFMTSVSVVDPDDTTRFAKFQIGFGHDVQSLKNTEKSLVVVATHEAEEQYSSDSRETFKVSRDFEGTISSIQVKYEQKLPFVKLYTTKDNETCYF